MYRKEYIEIPNQLKSSESNINCICRKSYMSWIRIMHALGILCMYSKNNYTVDNALQLSNHRMSIPKVYWVQHKKGQPGAWSSCFARGPEKGRTTWGLCTQPFPTIFARGYFHDLNPWPPGHKATAFTTAPRLPFLLGWVQHLFKNKHVQWFLLVGPWNLSLDVTYVKLSIRLQLSVPMLYRNLTKQYFVAGNKRYH
jgi:hypothetical protein